MKENLLRPKIWRSHYLPSIELVHGVSKSYSLPRHFHEELELPLSRVTAGDSTIEARCIMFHPIPWW
jgi:hypothetical protein